MGLAESIAMDKGGRPALEEPSCPACDKRKQKCKGKVKGCVKRGDQAEFVSRRGSRRSARAPAQSDKVDEMFVGMTTEAERKRKSRAKQKRREEEEGRARAEGAKKAKFVPLCLPFCVCLLCLLGLLCFFAFFVSFVIVLFFFFLWIVR